MKRFAEQMRGVMKKYHIQRGKMPFGWIFIIGVISGILLAICKKNMFSERTGMLDETTLYHMKYMTIDGSALFYYVLGLRMKRVLVFAVLVTTYLGLILCGGVAFGYGVSAGIFVGTVLLRYGLKGIFLVLAGVLPQYILYVPAFTALLLWGERIYGSIYLRHAVFSEAERKKVILGSVLQLAGILCLVFLGCLVESFINPGLLEKFLKIF